jgi:alanine dehydrogenase
VLIGVPREIKNHEYRVAMTPDGVRALVQAGHTIRVQAGAGSDIGFPDAAYREAGAELASTAGEIYLADMVVKVKEPQASETALLKSAPSRRAATGESPARQQRDGDRL